MAGFAALLPALTKGAKFGKAALSIASMFGGGGLTPAQQKAVAAQNQAMAQWFSDRNRYDNKGIELKLSQNANTIGFSRGKGDLQRAQLQAAGATFEDMQRLQVEMGSKLTGGFAKKGESTARTAGRAATLALLSKKTQAEARLANMGEVTAQAMQALKREYASKVKWHEGTPSYNKIPFPKGPGTLAQITGAFNRFQTTHEGLTKLGSTLSDFGSDLGSLFKGGKTK